MKTIIGFQSNDDKKIFVGKSYENGKHLQLTPYGNKLSAIGKIKYGVKKWRWDRNCEISPYFGGYAIIDKPQTINIPYFCYFIFIDEDNTDYKKIENWINKNKSGKNMKSTTARVSEDLEQWLISTFGTKGAGAEYLLEANYRLFQRNVLKFKKLFTENEIALMIDTLNGCMLAPQMAGQHIQANTEDGIDLDELNKKWEIDETALLSKIKTLTVNERMMLEIWCQQFWYQKEKRDLNEWLKK